MWNVINYLTFVEFMHKVVIIYFYKDFNLGLWYWMIFLRTCLIFFVLKVLLFIWVLLKIWIKEECFWLLIQNRALDNSISTKQEESFKVVKRIADLTKLKDKMVGKGNWKQELDHFLSSLVLGFA